MMMGFVQFCNPKESKKQPNIQIQLLAQKSLGFFVENALIKEEK